MVKLTVAARQLAAGVLGGVLLTGCQPTTPADRAAAPRQPSAPPTVAATGPGLTPRQRLMALADTVAAVPADATTDLPYTYLHTQTWARASTVIARIDQRRWCAADGSGREITRRLPDLPGVDRQPQPTDRQLFAQAAETLTWHPVSDLQPYLANPPTDPVALTAALTTGIPIGDPVYPRVLASGVVGLSISQYLPRQQRATALRVLAGIPGIAYQGKSRDLAGRAGLAFTVTTEESPPSTSTLVVDPHTGELLAAHERVTGRRPGLFSYVLILERGHTNVAPSTAGR
ncbi:CU044_5270 family protein [Micromonospora rubida]|uniref:CU044_5270 family protein n=1 Tax=Micromonospora rubida TaxID=2697657 RepID=A0ABW7SXE1_9ACTN